MRLLSRATPLLAGLAVAALALNGPGGAAPPGPSGPPEEAKGWRAVTVAGGVAHPWGVAWLPDGTALVTARGGTLYTVKDGKFIDVPVDGLPERFVQGQGGLLDVAVRPGKTDKPEVYLTLATGTTEANRTVLVRGVYDDGRVGRIESLYKVEPDKPGEEHFGSRLLWLPDGTLLMSVGDGGNPPRMVGGMLAREQAQNLRTPHGSVLRLTADGKPADDNPFRGKGDARPEIWTYGNRNVQGLALDAASGRVWGNEHGPKGGDEVNLLEKGKNYGWPVATFGRDYKTDEPIGKRSAEGMADPKVVWIPATAPSGLAFYTGDRFPKWKGSLFSGGLVGKDVRRIALDGDKVVGQERLTIASRVRDVRQGPDGHLYVLTDEKDGKLLRIEPE